MRLFSSLIHYLCDQTELYRLNPVLWLRLCLKMDYDVLFPILGIYFYSDPSSIPLLHSVQADKIFRVKAILYAPIDHQT